MTRVLAVIVVSALTANCATSAYRTRPNVAANHMTTSSSLGQDSPAVTAAYVKAIPLGTRITLTLSDGKRLKGTLLVVEEDAIVVRPRTRVPEPAQTIPLTRIATIEAERDSSGSMGRAIAIGAAVGAGAAMGVFFALIAALSD
jgi:hypothetical protein